MLTRPEAADGLKAMAANGMQWFDRALEGRTWLAGDRFTLADILLYCFLEFGTTVGQPIADDLANLKAWYDRVAARPSAAA
jgi:glutathione S-transferase